MNANAAAVETHRPRSVAAPPSRAFVFQRADRRVSAESGQIVVSASTDERGGLWDCAGIVPSL